MNPSAQLAKLTKIEDFASFEDKLKVSNVYPLKASEVEILQMNICRKCNLYCKHCHVNAGFHRSETMSREIIEYCIDAVKSNHKIHTIDITGGAPEMNEDLEWLLSKVSKLEKRVVVRSNLIILLERDYFKYIDVYTENKVEIVGSLPDYKAEKTDRQRGNNSFQKSIEVLKKLNRKGYGKKGTDLILNLVHNPVGAYLPGSQKVLENEYRRRLKKEYDIDFSNLYCITNMPVGRYLDYLMKSDNFYDYLTELHINYNTAAVPNVMCRTTVSVDNNGKLYDCDFNQMLELPISVTGYDHIAKFNHKVLSDRRIAIGNHCYGCTSGAGSSCQGCIE